MGFPGTLEDLHAGKYLPMLEDSELSRITYNEMKTLMAAVCAQLEELLKLRDEIPINKSCRSSPTHFVLRQMGTIDSNAEVFTSEHLNGRCAKLIQIWQAA